jgi:hypothetical protein
MENNIRLLFLAGSLLFAGCETYPDQLVEFETTNSPCIDAMIVNMRATMCQNIVTASADEGLSYRWCDDDGAIESTWNTAKFITVERDSYYSYDFSEAIPFCEDPSVIMFLDE